MKYLKLFDYNEYYFTVNQNQFDYYLQRDELFCFNDQEMKDMGDFLSEYNVDFYFSSASLYFMNDHSESYFWVADAHGLDKTLHYDSIMVHSSDGEIHKVTKSLTDSSKLPNRMHKDSYEVDREFTLNNFSVLISIMMGNVTTSIWLNKSFDEWFLCDVDEIEMYKCDQMPGIFKLLSEKLKDYKK